MEKKELMVEREERRPMLRKVRRKTTKKDVRITGSAHFIFIVEGEWEVTPPFMNSIKISTFLFLRLVSSLFLMAKMTNEDFR